MGYKRSRECQGRLGLFRVLRQRTHGHLAGGKYKGSSNRMAVGDTEEKAHRLHFLKHRCLGSQVLPAVSFPPVSVPLAFVLVPQHTAFRWIFAYARLSTTRPFSNRDLVLLVQHRSPTASLIPGKFQGPHVFEGTNN